MQIVYNDINSVKTVPQKREYIVKNAKNTITPAKQISEKQKLFASNLPAIGINIKFSEFGPKSFFNVS